MGPEEGSCPEVLGLHVLKVVGKLLNCSAPAPLEGEAVAIAGVL